MTAMLSLILIGIIVILVSYGLFIHSRKDIYKYSADFPSPPQLPLIGVAHHFSGNTTDIIKSIIRFFDTSKYNGFLNLWLGPKLYIGITHPPSIEIVLNQALEKDPGQKFMASVIGDGLLIGPVSIWRRHRKILSPAFNQRLLNQFVDIFAKQSIILVDKLRERVGKDEFDAYDYVGPCTLDILCETVMGVKMGAQNNVNHSYVAAFASQTSLLIKRIFHMWLWPQWLFNLSKYGKMERQNLEILHGFSKAVIQKKIAEMNKKQERVDNDMESNENPTDCKALLDLMIELSNQEEKKFTDKEFREEADTFMVTGHDTTSTGGSYVLMMLGCRPDIQDKVVDELRDIYGDSKRLAVKEDLPKMQYLERVIKETLRLFPPAPIIVRKLMQDVKLDDHILPAGVGCVIGIYGIHRDKKVWGENADDFDPDHFLPENCAKRHPYSYMPFSMGPRNCIGKQFAMMSMKVFLSTVLRSYKVHSTVDYKNIELDYGVLMKAKNGYQISVEPRLKL